MSIGIREFRIAIDHSLVLLNDKRKRYKSLRKKIRIEGRRLDALEETRKIFQAIAEELQQTIHEKLAGVVTKCLQMMFGQRYEFDIRFEQKRGKTEARLLFIKDGMELDPLSSSGGGVIDVATFALRIGCLALTNNVGLLLMDEPFKNLSDKYKHKASEMIDMLAYELQTQLIITTHIDEFKKEGMIII